MFSKAVIIAAAAALASAQQSVYQQCGGINYSGGTQCGAGLTCSTINSYYYQCLSATGASTTMATSTKPASTTAKSTTPVSTSKVSTTTPKTTTPATTAAPTSTASGTTVSAGVSASGNPFAGKQFYANPYYQSEVYSLAIPALTASSDKAKASAIAKVGSFTWLDTAAKVPTMDTYLADIQKQNAAGANIIGQFVVYDLPDRDCAAAASNGEYSVANNGVANYHAYIDSIAAIVKKYPTVSIALIIEPDSLGNLITNMGVQKCANAADAYKSCIEYAISTLNIPNVSMYLDAGHSGWLGWSSNIGPAAQLFGQIYKAAGSPAQVRGLATNVANYNGWSLATCPSYTSPNTNCDEKKYINALAPLLAQQGFPQHFVTDTGRNGVQPTAQIAQGDWCNLIGTGFGVRPSTNTGDPLLDAFLWIKPGGECDGTSNTTATRYDYHCGLDDALKPAPEAGTWFQAYFAQLLTNANPSF